MSSTVKTVIKYLLTLSLGVFLLYYLVSNQSESEQQNIIKGFQNADYTWIALTVFISLLEKIIRAYRWNLLLEPLNYKPSVRTTFNSVMIAYLANIFAPRMGEVARCAILKKTDNVPINTSFGTVVSERVVDLICLLILIPFSLLFEYQKISELLIRTWNKLEGVLLGSMTLLIAAGAFFLLLILALFLFRSKIKNNSFFLKVKAFIAGVFQSMLSIRHLPKKGQFIACTVLIWISYYLMTYLAFYSLEATSGLSLSAGLVVLVVGGLGMAAPVQAGIGAFHAIVKETLEEVYGIGGGWALPYAFIVHTSQTALAFFGGLICLIFVFRFGRKEKTELKHV